MRSAITSGFAVSTPTARWITPEEQLERLDVTVAKEQVYTSRLGELSEVLTHAITESTTRSILRRSDLSTESDIPLLQDLDVESYSLPSTLTNWYKARKCLNNLPEKIPPLPRNIHQILNGKCPIYEGKKIEDTHFLQLICQEDGSLNQFETVTKAYGRIHYPEGQNPLRFRSFWDEAHQEHSAVPFEPTHWELITKDVIPGSQKKSYDAQVAMINALSQKSFVNYEVPSLSMFRALFLHKVATEESLYTAGSEQNRNVYTYSHVRESTRNYQLGVGGSAPSGLEVISSFDRVFRSIGIGALRKF